MNDTFEQRLANAPSTLRALLQKPFPILSPPIDNSINWTNFAELLSGTDNWLVETIGVDYTDPGRDEDGDSTSPEDLGNDYLNYFEATIANIEAAFGCRALRINNHDPSEELEGNALTPKAKPVHFPDAFFSFDEASVAYWEIDGCVAVVHFASQWGDGDFQTSICVGVLKLATN